MFIYVDQLVDWKTRLAAGAVFIFFLSSCATQDRSEPYVSADNIGEIPKELVIGTWRSTPLNPATDALAVNTTLEYRANGTLNGTIETMSNESDGTPALQLNLNGIWHVEGDWLRHTDIRIRAVGENAYARQYNQVLNASSQEFGTVTNVLELDEVRMITVSKDGRATLYTRQ